MDKIEYRIVIKFFTKGGNTPEQINNRLRAVYGDFAPSYATVKNWAKLFKWDRESMQDDPRPGWLIEATTPDIVAKIDKYKIAEIQVKFNFSKNVIVTVDRQDCSWSTCQSLSQSQSQSCQRMQ